MTRLLQVATTHMLQNTKRKVPDDEMGAETTTMTTKSNPLVNAAKKAKREAKTNASNKRKLANTEEQPGGLLIVRAPSAPPTTTTNPTKPPSKKFKASQPQAPSHSQPLPSTSKPPSTQSKSKSNSLLPSSQPALHLHAHSRHDTPDADPALDDAVRAMQDEAAHLRRTSRGPIHAPDTSSSSGSGSSLNSQFRFPSSVAANENGKGKRRETIHDTSAPLPPEADETPLIQRNKRLRAGAMAALGAGVDTMDPLTPPGGSGSGHRRKSSVGGRGKRMSSSYESTGVITQPHPTVADTAFFKHIDTDLPDAERVRQLLIWCSARASSSTASSSSSSSSHTTTTSSSSSNPNPPPPLPPLSTKAAKALKATQDDIVRKLAERKVDLSLFGGRDEEMEEGEGGEKKVNAQNVTNRTWEGVYGGHIRSAMEEEEAWKKVSYTYDAYAKRLRTNLEKRRAALVSSSSPTTTTPTTTNNNPTPATTSTHPPPSPKAQGKQRALTPAQEPREQDLPLPFQAGVRMARAVFARARARRRGGVGEEGEGDVSPGAGPSRKGVHPDSRVLPTHIDTPTPSHLSEAEEQEATETEKERQREKTFKTRMGEVEYKLDHLRVLANQARAAAETAERALDWRFEVLAGALDARDRVSVSSSGAGEGGILGRYVQGRGGAGGGAGGGGGRQEDDEALRLLRALARVDAARPPAQVGDAARRAVREAQRVGVVGDRRVTGVWPTPKKMPGTPRRGTTPSRERER
ncbi:Mis12-Mtw1 protein family-domain-containing protein [Lyophyllum atratum]|nr:Mis12-Mtw1 protein family-domain-containing protein [Lyophyllum atratum]